MQFAWIGRFLFWLLALGMLALGLALGTQLGLEAVGVPRVDAITVSTAAAVAVALAAADVFTPIGQRQVKERFEEDPVSMLPDFLVAGLVGGATAGAARLLGGVGAPVLGTQTVATLLGVGVGYVAFLALNREMYRPQAGDG